MKKFISTAMIFAVLATALVNLSSCKKDEAKLPNIAFKTTANYTSADKTVVTGTTVAMGITASKGEDEDVLKTFTVTKSINGAAATTLLTVTLTSAEENSYTRDYSTIVYGTGTPGYTEKWTFAITSRDGLTNSVSLTLTVN